MKKAFYNKIDFPFTKTLEDNWGAILAEYDMLKHSDQIPYFEEDMYSGEWKVFPFIFFGEIKEENCNLCPQTWELIKDIPGLVTASFSILKPDTEIFPHTGFTGEVLRTHLGLRVPGKCAIIVRGERKLWKGGECFVFDDTLPHSAYNLSQDERVVLIIDVKKPEMLLG